MSLSTLRSCDWCVDLYLLCIQIQEKPLSELSLPHVDSETSLIERIRSIKEEKSVFLSFFETAT